MLLKRNRPHTRSNQIKSNQIKSNQIKSNQIKSNQIKSNQIKSNQIKSNQIKSNQIKSNQIKSNQIKSNQIKHIFSNSNFTKLINYIKLQRDFTQKVKKRTFQMLRNRKFQNLMSWGRAYNQIALAKLSGDALLG